VVERPGDVWRPHFGDQDWVWDAICLIGSGSAWPDGSETALRELADAWREGAQLISDMLQDADPAALDILMAYSGGVGMAFSEFWNELAVGPATGFPVVYEAMGELAAGTEAIAMQIEYEKLVVLISVIIAVISIIIAIIMAFFSAGGSTAAIPGIIATARQAVITAFRQLLTAAGRQLLKQALLQALRRLSLRVLMRTAVTRLTQQLTWRWVATQALKQTALQIGQQLVTEVLAQGYQIATGTREDWDTRQLEIAGFSALLAGPLSVLPYRLMPGHGGWAMNMGREALANVVADQGGGFLATGLYAGLREGDWSQWHVPSATQLLQSALFGSVLSIAEGAGEHLATHAGHLGHNLTMPNVDPSNLSPGLGTGGDHMPNMGDLDGVNTGVPAFDGSTTPVPVGSPSGFTGTTPGTGQAGGPPVTGGGQSTSGGGTTVRPTGTTTVGGPSTGGPSTGGPSTGGPSTGGPSTGGGRDSTTSGTGGPGTGGTLPDGGVPVTGGPDGGPPLTPDTTPTVPSGPAVTPDGGPPLTPDGGVPVTVGPDGGPPLTPDGRPTVPSGPAVTPDGGPPLTPDGGTPTVPSGPAVTPDGGPAVIPGAPTPAGGPVHTPGVPAPTPGGPPLTPSTTPTATTPAGTTPTGTTPAGATPVRPGGTPPAGGVPTLAGPPTTADPTTARPDAGTRPPDAGTRTPDPLRHTPATAGPPPIAGSTPPTGPVPSTTHPTTTGPTPPHSDGPPSGPPPDSPGPPGTPDGPDIQRSDGPTANGSHAFEAPPVHFEGDPTSPEARQAVMNASAALADAVQAHATEAGLGPRQTPYTAGAMITPDGTIHSHTSMRADRGVQPHAVPEPHPLAQQVLDQIAADAAASGDRLPMGHGQCAEVALVSDRLYDLEAQWQAEGSPGDFATYAHDHLAGSTVSTHRIGDHMVRDQAYPHGELMPPCATCGPFLDAFDINHVADGPDGGASPTTPPPPDSPPPPSSPPPDIGAVGPGHPIDPSRPYNTPDGLLPPDPADQAALDAVIPRESDGTPQVHPDPRDGRWLDNVNDGGTNETGRANNCADCALSFTATWYGDPTVSAPTADPTTGGEGGGPARIEQVLGTSFEHVGTDATALDVVADQLRAAGPGSSAVIANTWNAQAGGGGHGWNMVNHDGTILYVDSQGRSVTTTPPSFSGFFDNVWAIVLDADGNPYHPPPAGPSATPPASAGPHRDLPDRLSTAPPPDVLGDQPTDTTQPTDADGPDGPDQPPDGDLSTVDDIRDAVELRERAVDAVVDRLGIEDPRAAEALRTAYDVVHDYTAPFLVDIVDRMLVDLRADLARNPDATVVFVGRDGHSMAVAAQRLDPDFFAAHGKEVVLSRAVVESAMLDSEINGGMSFPDAADFRGAAGKVDPADIEGARQRLTQYLQDRGIPVGRPGSEVILVDTSYKGTVQELLAALYPDTAFSGKYAFFGASPLDPHPGTKTGYALHLDPDPVGGGRPLRSLPEEAALTFANQDAVGTVEETMHGDLSSPRRFGPDGVPEQHPQRYDPALSGLNPTRVSEVMADPLVREGVKVVNLLAIADVADGVAARRADGIDPADQLRQGADGYRDQVRQWVSGSDTVDPRFQELMDSFVRRGDKGIIADLSAAIDRAGLSVEQAMSVWRDYDAQPTLDARRDFVDSFVDDHPDGPDEPPDGDQPEAQTGGSTRPVDDVQAWAWAEEMYDQFRADDTDIADIAQNLATVERPDGRTGYTPDEIRQVKDHLMVEEHPLDDYNGGTVNRHFDADPDIADAWVRLREGTPLDADLVLLEHELAESNYLREHPGATYREAHNHANQSHNWQSIIPGQETTHGHSAGLQEGPGGQSGGGVRLRVPGDGPPVGDRQDHPGRQTGGRDEGPELHGDPRQDPQGPAGPDDVAGDGDVRGVTDLSAISRALLGESIDGQVVDYADVLGGVPEADFVRLSDGLVDALAQAGIPAGAADVTLARSPSGDLVVRISSDQAFLNSVRQWDPTEHAATLGTRPFAPSGPLPPSLVSAAIPGLGHWISHDLAPLTPGQAVRLEVLPSRGPDAGTPPTTAEVPIHRRDGTVTGGLHTTPPAITAHPAAGELGPGGVPLGHDEQGRVRPIDRSGHMLRDSEIAFINEDEPIAPLDQDAIDRWAHREAPLGMPPQWFGEFQSSLRDALAADGIDPGTVDVRLKGSAAEFFSGPRKSMPTMEGLAADLESGRISPEAYDRAVGRLTQMLSGSGGEPPVARPFDTMYRLGLDPERSDYDINVCSDEMFRRALSMWDENVYGGVRGDGTREVPIKPADRNHGYLTNDVLVRNAFPHLREWAAHWDERLGRHMSYAIFMSSGPEDTTMTPGHSGVSVHYRDTDWVILRPERS